MRGRAAIANKNRTFVYTWIGDGCFCNIFCLKWRRSVCSLGTRCFCIADIAIFRKWFLMLWTVWTTYNVIKTKFTFHWANRSSKWKMYNRLWKGSHLVWLLLSKCWLTVCFLLITRLCRILRLPIKSHWCYDHRSTVQWDGSMEWATIDGAFLFFFLLFLTQKYNSKRRNRTEKITIIIKVKRSERKPTTMKRCAVVLVFRRRTKQKTIIKFQINCSSQIGVILCCICFACAHHVSRI